MDNYIIVKAFGLETRTWTYKDEYGYGCAECCNGDRCDEDCTAKYRRPNCPHCKGRGWIKKEDVEPDNTQLPAEVEIEIAAKAEAIFERMKEHAESEWDVKYAEGFAEGWADCASEYAAKLHDSDQKIELLMKARKSEAEFIDKAIALLGKLVTNQHAFILPEKIHNEIKTFLDGTK
jgi:flagellar biosynthesis/type III secretory pathway protein FliH